jgi:hypothetical protein
MDWATRQAMQDREAEQRAANNAEKSVRDARLKDSRGLELFQQLNQWMREQVDSYNQQMGKKLMETTVPRIVGGLDTSQSFTVSRTDHQRSPLKVIYFPESHRIKIECGAGPKEFNLVVGEDGEVYFQTPNRQRFVTIDQLGEHLLDHWNSASI